MDHSADRFWKEFSFFLHAVVNEGSLILWHSLVLVSVSITSYVKGMLLEITRLGEKQQSRQLVSSAAQS